MITIEGLNKFYGSKQVLSNINLSVNDGECLGIVGKNGAGKTTLLECIENLRSWDSGSISFKCCQNITKGSDFLGVQLQSSSLPAEIKVIEAIDLFAAEHGVTYDEGSYEKLGLQDFLNKKYNQLSTGQKRRLHLFLAILHDPEIVILDEPTAGLDIEGKIQLYDVIEELKEKRKTILITSHDMIEVEKLCDRVAFVVDGCIVKIEDMHDGAREGRESALLIRTKSGAQNRFREIATATCCGMCDEYEEYHCTSISSFLNEYVPLIIECGDEIEDICVKKGSIEEELSDLIRGE